MASAERNFRRIEQEGALRWFGREGGVRGGSITLDMHYIEKYVCKVIRNCRSSCIIHAGIKSLARRHRLCAISIGALVLRLRCPDWIHVFVRTPKESKIRTCSFRTPSRSSRKPAGCPRGCLRSKVSARGTFLYLWIDARAYSGVHENRETRKLRWLPV